MAMAMAERSREKTIGNDWRRRGQTPETKCVSIHFYRSLPYSKADVRASAVAHAIASNNNRTKSLSREVTTELYSFLYYPATRTSGIEETSSYRAPVSLFATFRHQRD